MINDKAILVGVDGSHASYKATWWAANYAKHAGLTLQIVCAYSLPSYAAVSFDATYTAMGDDNAAHNDAQEILSKAKAIADEQGVEASTLIVTGDPASVFVELSRNYNLIVIGNRGKGGLAERLLGTTSSSLPAYAYCPIVVVPYTDDEGNLMHLNNTITKVAVGSDESKWGLKALEIAAAFADSWGAELDVISAVPNMKGSEDEGVMASFQEDLDVRIKPLEEAYPNLKINKQIVPGPAAGALTKASYDHDVVVVGSRGRGGFTGLLLGSTSQGLLQHAVGPVYVVPRKYVEAAETRLDTVPSSPADVTPKAKSQPPSNYVRYVRSVLDGDVHTHWRRLDVRMLDRAALLDMTADAIGELFGVLVAQTGVGGVDDHLLVETDVGVGIGIIRAVHHDLRALAIAQRMLDGELAGQRGATGQRDLHQIARRELATALAELDVRAILAERVPGTVLVALYPQPLAHGNSSCPVARRSRQSVIPI